MFFGFERFSSQTNILRTRDITLVSSPKPFNLSKDLDIEGGYLPQQHLQPPSTLAMWQMRSMTLLE